MICINPMHSEVNQTVRSRTYVCQPTVAAEFICVPYVAAGSEVKCVSVRSGGGVGTSARISVCLVLPECMFVGSGGGGGILPECMSDGSGGGVGTSARIYVCQPTVAAAAGVGSQMCVC